MKVCDWKGWEESQLVKMVVEKLKEDRNMVE